jgi:tRNA threonylcarbamoyladenosine biosynthesis protein TsaE
MTEFTFHSASELKDWVPTFLKQLGSKKTVAFQGDLGSGKTTFIKYLCERLAVEDRVTSPTFSIVNQYQTSRGETVYHIDLYRLNKVEEAIEIGIEEYLDSGAWVCIEWPELIGHLLPEDTMHVKIEVLGPVERKIVLL